MNAEPPTAAPAPASKRRGLRALVSAGAVLLAALAAWGGWQAWQRSRPPTEPWIAATVQRGDLEDLVTATGSLQPRDYVDVGAQISGQLRRIHVAIGSEVSEGDLLAEIDAEQSAARVEANRALLRSQQARLAELDLTLVKARRDLQRQRNLAAEDATTAEALQNADTTLSMTATQIASLKAQMDQTRATMRVDEANLKYTRIFAPMSGTVVSVTARQGQTLNTNQSAPTLLRIADLSTMQVQTQVSEADVSRLRTGMPVYFTTLGSQGQRWTGSLQQIEPTPTVTNNVVLYNALFEVPNPNRSLMTQMTAQVFFVAAHVQDALLVPMSALTMTRTAPGDGAAGPARRGPRGADAAPPPGPAGTGAGGDARPPRPLPGEGAPAVAAAPAPGAPRFDRTAWAQMSDADRERLRSERRAQREATGGAAAGPNAATRPGAAPRPATVKVIGADGVTQERPVLVGVSNRVQAQILSGLEDGERVVAGQRSADGARPGASTPRAAGTTGLGPGFGPGFGPPPGGR